MTNGEKVARLKGLMEGMELDQSTKEGKLFAAIADILENLADDVADLEDYTTELTEQVDAVDEDLNSLEEDFYEEWDEDDDDDCCCCDGCDEDDFDGDYYDITCPSCKEEFSVDEDTLLDGGIDCPNCGEHLEFDIEEEDDEEPGKAD